MDVHPVRAWLETHRDLWLDLVRIYLGAALFVKGVVFVGHTSALMQSMANAQVPFGSLALMHYIVAAHIAGGLMLLFGIATRAAAAANIPVLAGAALFVHRREGLFSANQSLELTLLVLFLLVVMTLSGSGRLSVDHYRHASGYEDEQRRPLPA